MGRNLQSDHGGGDRLRPVDLAREHGLSTQAVRNYEEAGILPPAARTPAGYRAYTRLHAQALRAFLALVAGHGHGTAAAIMRAVNAREGDPGEQDPAWQDAAREGAAQEAYRLIDESHARLLDDRRTLQAVTDALRELGPAGRESPEGADTFIGPLAAALGLRPATLRTWERAGLVRPRRDPRTGYRVYDPAAARDARLAHQLRRGGYLLEQIAPLLAQVRSAGGPEALEAALTDWRGRLAARGRAMLHGAAELDAYLRALA